MRQIDINSHLTACVLNIARQAGSAIMEFYTSMRSGNASVQDMLLTDKSDNSPLTRADLLAHQIILQGLEKLTPGVAVISEEDSTLHATRAPIGEFWLIDPLDGTKEFLSQSGEFTVNIALVRCGRPVFGVVVCPALDQHYWGGCGLGAFRELSGQIAPIRVADPVPAGQPIRVVVSKSHMNSRTSKFVRHLGPHELVQAGSSLKFCRVAEGASDIYPRLGPTCEWDTAAAQAILEAAGGHVSSLDGRALQYGKPNVLNPDFVAASAPFLSGWPVHD